RSMSSGRDRRTVSAPSVGGVSFEWTRGGECVISGAMRWRGIGQAEGALAPELGSDCCSIGRIASFRHIGRTGGTSEGWGSGRWVGGDETPPRGGGPQGRDT